MKINKLNVSALATLSFSRKKKTQKNMNLAILEYCIDMKWKNMNISNTIEKGKKKLGGIDINKNNSKCRKDNFKSFVFNLVRELDMAINAAIASSKLGR